MICISNYRLLVLMTFVMLTSSTVVSQVSLRKDNHECGSSSSEDRALLNAVTAKNYVTVSQLLRQGANPNAKDDCNVSAVTYAAALHRPDILKELITAGADVDAIDSCYNRPPLLWALDSSNDENKEGVYEVVKLLAQAGADVNLTGTSRQTPLILAVSLGLDNVAKLLVSKGAHINAEDDEGKTAYSHAVIQGNNELRNLLVAAGADTKVGVKDYRVRYGRNAFIQAASDGRTDIVVAMLADATDANTANEAGVTALMRVVNDSTLDELLSAGANVNKKDNAGFTALIWACFFGRTSHVKKMLAAGADVNATTYDSATPLNMAKPHIKKILIEAGATR